MSRAYGEITETLMQRVRQAGGLAVLPDLALKIYSHCEQVSNAYTHRVIASTTLNIAKQKLLIHYRDATEGISDAIDILSIRQSNRRIEKCDSIAKLSAYDIDWFRAITGTRFEAWCQIGRDILILYPGQAAASSVTVEYAQLIPLQTDFAAAYNTPSALPDEDIELPLKLAEIVLLTRFRQLTEAAAIIKSLAEKLFPQKGGQK
jgi:hypothetical protein